MNTQLRLQLLVTVFAVATLVASPASTIHKSNKVTSFELVAKDKSAKTAFKELIKAEEPVFIKVIKSYCPYCKAITEPFESLAQKYEGRAHFIEVDGLQFPSITKDHDIGLVPAFIIYHKGKKIDQFKRGNFDRIEKYLSKLGIRPNEVASV